MINRAIKPAPSEEITFRLPETEKFKTENGLQVYFVKRAQLPILRFNLILNAGSKSDPAGKKGMVNLFAMMLDEGAGEYDALQLNDEFDILGSNFDISANNDNVFISLRTLKENTERSLQLFSDVITKPHFDENAFAREKRKILTRLLQLKDDPDEIANIIFEKYIFGENSPYSYPVIGYEEDIKNISIEDLKAFYHSALAPQNSAMIVVGDSDNESVLSLLNKYFSEWKNTDQQVYNPVSPGKNENKIFLVHKEGAVQTEIRVGHLSGGRNSPDYFNKLVLNTILGGQFTSRINLNLRENKGYTYGAFSRFSYYKDASYYYVSTSVNAENTGNAVKEILKELEGIKDGVTTGELEFAKSSIIRKFPSNFETNRHIASNISAIIIHSLPEDYFNNYLDNIRKVTIDDVNRSATDSISARDALIVVVGDKKDIQNQLSGLNKEIIELESSAA
jgi:zinc protease